MGGWVVVVVVCGEGFFLGGGGATTLPRRCPAPLTPPPTGGHGLRSQPLPCESRPREGERGEGGGSCRRSSAAKKHGGTGPGSSRQAAISGCTATTGAPGFTPPEPWLHAGQGRALVGAQGRHRRLSARGGRPWRQAQGRRRCQRPRQEAMSARACAAPRAPTPLLSLPLLHCPPLVRLSN